LIWFRKKKGDIDGRYKNPTMPKGHEYKEPKKQKPSKESSSFQQSDNVFHWLTWPDIKDGKRRYCIPEKGVIFADEYIDKEITCRKNNR